MWRVRFNDSYHREVTRLRINRCPLLRMRHADPIRGLSACRQPACEGRTVAASSDPLVEFSYPLHRSGRGRDGTGSL